MPQTDCCPFDAQEDATFIGLDYLGEKIKASTHTNQESMVRDARRTESNTPNAQAPLYRINDLHMHLAILEAPEIRVSHPPAHCTPHACCAHTQQHSPCNLPMTDSHPLLAGVRVQASS